MLFASIDLVMVTGMETKLDDALTAAQCRMARAGLGLSIAETSKISLVSSASIVRFENGSDIRPVLRSALRTAFERGGVVFTANGIELADLGAVA